MRSAVAVLAAAVVAGAWAQEPANPQAMLLHYEQQAGSKANAAEGKRIFTQKHGREWSCASCHNAQPTTAGKHASTGKLIEPLAPAANTARFTKLAKTEKWFKRNCRDVLARECSAQEKADMLAWLISLK